MSFDEKIQQKQMRKPEGTEAWPPDIHDAWDKRKLILEELDEGISGGQMTREELGEGEGWPPNVQGAECEGFRRDIGYTP